MLIETMPQVLAWSSKGEELDLVYRSYIETLSDVFGKTLLQIRHQDPALGEQLIASVRSASDEAFSRILTAPETSHRLLWRARHHLDLPGQFLLQSIQAEASRIGNPMQFEQETWTALGDVGFFPTGEVFRFPQLPGLMPLDFGSPYATKIDMTGREQIMTKSRPGFDSSEICRVLTLLRLAQQGIQATNPAILDFTIRFNKVLVLQKDLDAPTSFSSGSHGQYIARSFIANPHLPKVDEVDIAEAIIHEAIHGLLYMQERDKRWVLNPAFYAPDPVVASPWTGNPLDLRPFLQACFVWYGLLNFWCLALEANTFDRARIHTRISRAIIGFLNQPLLSYITSYLPEISTDVLDAIEIMQKKVTTAFAVVT
jgi:hypothetical protein